MAEHPLVLSDEEQQYLITHLRSALGETRVESHHTRTSAYREQVRGRSGDATTSEVARALLDGVLAGA